MSKILYVASTISHIRSFHLPYIEALRSEGHRVLVMANGEGADFNIPFRKKILSSKNRKCRKMIKEILEKENFNSIILNTSLAAFHVRLAAGGRRPRILNIVHGYLFSEKSRGVKAKIKARLLLLAEQLLRGRTDAVITMNGEDYGIAKKYKLAAKVEGCRGMGIPRREPTVALEAIRAEHAAEGKYVLLFVGELSQRKNQELLIRALPKIREDIPEAELWLIGEGDERATLEALAAELKEAGRVKFLGRKENPTDYMRAADLYVSASKIEGLPFNVAEAMSVGASCLLSDVKGHRDLAEGGAALLFSPNSAEEFARGVVEIYGGKRLLNKDDVLAGYERYSFDNVFAETYEKIKRHIGAGEDRNG